MSEISDYLKTVKSSQRVELRRIYKTIKQTVPEAEESISYGIPAFKLNKKPLIYFAAFKNHMSLFPVTGSIQKDLSRELSCYKTAKGTLQFTEDNTISDALLKKIIAIRLKDIASG
jgi:uncharacterized protein YdhG (YjbR/CyaY superfamily)